MSDGGKGRSRRRGFTLVEAMIAMALAGVVLSSTLVWLSSNQRLWAATDQQLQASGEANLAMQFMVNGAYGEPGLRMAEWNPVGPRPFISTSQGQPARIDFDYGTNAYFYLLNDSGQIVDRRTNVLCSNVSSLSFSRESSKPGTLKIDLTVMRNGAPLTDRYVRLVTWVACRNRPHSP